MYFPPRILDIGTNQQMSIKLVESHFTRQESHYICLSHCWGQTKALRTTRESLPSHWENLTYSNLPPTFQDAVDVTRYLGVRYLWIDSLCIIQDDEADWVAQSSQMDAIYSNSLLTISATVAKDAMSGIFRQIDPTSNTEIRDPSALGKQTGLFGRPQKNHFELEYLTGEDNVLLTRAWAYQEHLLSPRLIFFGLTEVSYQCNEQSHCFCSPYAHEPLFKHDISRVLHPSSKHHLSEIIASWHMLIDSYSGKHLTKEKDRLPALSGIAKKYKRVMNTQYLAGLWEISLAEDLCWEAYSEDRRRPDEYLGPSWSWVSINGKAIWMFRPGEFWANFDIIEASVTPSTSDPTGAVASGFIRLSGHLIHGDIKTGEDNTNTHWIFQTANKDYWIGLDAGNDDFATCDATNQPIFGFYLGFSPRDYYDHGFMLMLRELSGAGNPTRSFRHVGISAGWHKASDMVTDMRAEREEIIVW